MQTKLIRHRRAKRRFLDIAMQQSWRLRSFARRSHHDPQAFLRQVPPLFAQEEPEDRQAPKPRHVFDACSRARARACGPVLQAALILQATSRGASMIKDLVVNLS